MSRKSLVGYAAGIILTVWEMIVAYAFYYEVLYVLNPSFWAAFWAWQHFLPGLVVVPILVMLAIKEIKRRNCDN